MRGLLCGFITLCMITSCQKQVDSMFQESVSARIEKSLQEYDKELKSSENGWVLQYYPGKDQDKGGYNYYLKFKENNLVEVALEQSSPIQTEYLLHQNGGIMLSFVTYNSNIHQFATPSRFSPSADEGDFEFQLTSFTQDEILLTGMKYRSKMRMIRLREPFSSYAKRTQQVKRLLSGADIGIFSSDGFLKTISFNFDERIYEGVSFIFTDRGIHFYKPVTIGQVETQDLLLDQTNKKLQSVDSHLNMSVVSSPIDFSTKEWIVTIEGTNSEKVSPKLEEAWNKAKDTNEGIFPGYTWPVEFHIGSGSRSYERGFWIFLEDIPVQYYLSFKGSFENESDLRIVPEKGGEIWFLFEHLDPFIQLLEGSYQVEELPNQDDVSRYKLTKRTDSTIFFEIKERK